GAGLVQCALQVAHGDGNLPPAEVSVRVTGGRNGLGRLAGEAYGNGPVREPALSHQGAPRGRGAQHMPDVGGMFRQNGWGETRRGEAASHSSPQMEAYRETLRNV